MDEASQEEYPGEKFIENLLSRMKNVAHKHRF